MTINWIINCGIPTLEYYTTMKMNELLHAIISGYLTSLKYKLERRKKTPKDCILDDILFIKLITKKFKMLFMDICLFDKTIRLAINPEF